MAQVTMDMKEYMELHNKVVAYDSLYDQMAKAVTVEIAPEYPHGYRVDTNYCVIREALRKNAKVVAEKLASDEKAMRSLVKETYTVLDVRTGYMVYKWSADLAPHEVDLTDFPVFRKAWEAMIQKMAKENEEGTEDEE